MKDEFLRKEMNLDFSDRDLLERESLMASISNIKHKDLLWKRYKDGQNYNVFKLKASSEHFYDILDDITCS